MQTTAARTNSEIDTGTFGLAAGVSASVSEEGLKIAVLGNHSVPYSTESELDWTIEHLGHKVIKFQENGDTTTDAITQICIEEGIDLFIYIHTHGWQLKGYLSELGMINKLGDNGIITCSFHLDRYWGLNRLDHRETRVGEHPFWKTDFVFTADGGNQERFRERGINHYWLPPAVVERDCYFGSPRPDLITEVAFVGSESYHPEYPQRGELIQWLRETYGDRFRRFAGDVDPPGTMRGADLNDLYASIKVVVGDSCFAGAPYYWSDRVPETLGRGGFLIHPRVKGLDIPGLVTHEPGDYEKLKKMIDYYLAHDKERTTMRNRGFDEVKAKHTYTNRLNKMLRVMGFING